VARVHKNILFQIIYKSLLKQLHQTIKKAKKPLKIIKNDKKSFLIVPKGRKFGYFLK